MTIDDFINAVSAGPVRKRPRMGPVALGMARRILVDGLTVADAASEAGRTKQEASRAALRVLRRHDAGVLCPTCCRPL
jgi:hypothetical protein